MPLKGNLIGMTLDISAITRSVQDDLKQVMYQGITAWVEEAKSNIPVWAGASRAALTQIAGFVGIPVFGPGKGTGRAHSNEIVAVPPRAKVSPADGAASESFVAPHVEGKKVVASWTTNLYHLSVNEVVNVNLLSHRFKLIQPGPYNLRDKCEQAVKASFDRDLARIQFRIGSYIRYINIKVGG
jgi:hypothetical protein